MCSLTEAKSLASLLAYLEDPTQEDKAIWLDNGNKKERDNTGKVVYFKLVMVYKDNSEFSFIYSFNREAINIAYSLFGMTNIDPEIKKVYIKKDYYENYNIEGDELHLFHMD